MTARDRRGREGEGLRGVDALVNVNCPPPLI